MVLRNRFDQNTPFQDADVYIDGAKAGTWHAVGGNLDTAWEETDFTVPASFTSGKSSVTVRLVNLSSTNVWNEYRISVYSILTGAGGALPPSPGATHNIANADFESGDLTGWTVLSGSEFTNARVTSQTTQNGYAFQQHGTYHLFGWDTTGAGDTPTGSMRTPDFLLGGDGRIDFLVGGGRNLSDETVSLVRSDGTVLFTATGHDLETYYRVVFDAADFIGSTMHLVVTDNGTGGWGHINLDDIHVPVSTFTSNVTGSWNALSGSWVDTAAGRQGTAGSGADVFQLSTESVTDATVEADITITGSGAGAVVARANAAATQFYAANIDYTNQRVVLWGPGIPGAVAALPVALNTTYHLKLSLVGSAIRIYVSTYSGGTTPIISTTDSTYSSGLVGINAWNGTATIQNLVVG
jgi:hypothetical protein